MKSRTFSIVAVAGISLVSGVLQAETINVKTNKSYADVRPDRFITSCVDAIEDFHKKEAKLFLNRRGQFSTEDSAPSFAIQGWVWKDGKRTQATHNCEANRGEPGLVLNIDYANERQVAEGPKSSRTES